MPGLLMLTYSLHVRESIDRTTNLIQTASCKCPLFASKRRRNRDGDDGEFVTARSGRISPRRSSRSRAPILHKSALTFKQQFHRSTPATALSSPAAVSRLVHAVTITVFALIEVANCVGLRCAFQATLSSSQVRSATTKLPAATR